MGVSGNEQKKVLCRLDRFKADNPEKKIVSFVIDKYTKLSNGRHVDYIRGVYIYHEPSNFIY